MFTKFSAALMIAALGLTAGLTASAHAASQTRACDASDVRLAQYICPVIPQLPTLPQEPPHILPLLPIQPRLIPTIPVCPAPLPRPQIILPAPRAVAVTGDDNGCIPPYGQKPSHPTPSPRPSNCLDIA